MNLLLDRNDYNKAIVALATAESMHRAQRAAYMKLIRNLGTDLRKKFCDKGGPATWLTATHMGNTDNPHRYGVQVKFDSNSQECIDAITKYMEGDGWSKIHIVYTSDFSTSMVAY